MSRIPSVAIILVYLFYLYVCVHNLFGDTDPVLIGLDIFCGATCLGGIALFVALILEGKPSLEARHYAMGSPR
jgi:hypothetical protein